jgi:hypothetical protein
MNNEYTQTGFVFASTEDGSPTLIQLGEKGEMMHHSGGAAAETRYIYKSVIAHCLAESPERLKTCVVGLGLGYIEMCWAMEIDSHNLKVSENISLISYEIDQGLIESFQSWVDSNSVNSPNASIYDQISKSIDADVSIQTVKVALENNFNRYPVKGNFAAEFEKDNSLNLICFDAFSQKTNQELWTPEFLNRFLVESAHADCVLTTYACTGHLKKALRDNGFEVIQRPAFIGYGDSTLALRGRFKSLASLFRTS